MPAVAVIAAIGTVSTGAALGGIMGGIMVAGGVLSAVGAVTGNKDLMKIGALASLGAGIGSYLGIGSAAATSAEAALSAAPVGGLDLPADYALQGATQAASGLGDIAPTLGLDQALGDAAQISGFDLPASNMPGLDLQSNGLIGGSMPKLQGSALAPERLGEPVRQASAPAAPPVESYGAAEPLDATVKTEPYLSQNQSTSAVAPTSPKPENNSSFVDQATKFLRNKDNAELVKTGSGLIGGAMGEYSKQAAAQQQFDRQQSLIEAARARYNNSITGQRQTAPRTIIR